MTQPIPRFGLYGDDTPFPDLVHVEDFAARAPQHGWTIAAHRHSGMAQTFAIERGTAQARYDGTTRPLSDGQFLYIPEDCVHAFTFDPGILGLVISVPTSIRTGLGPPSGPLHAALTRPFVGALSPALTQTTQMLAQTGRGASAFRDQQRIGLAHTVLALVAEQAPARPTDRRPARLGALDALIETHRADGWSAADYAAALAISRGHLSRLCRAATGLGAAAYIDRSAMDEAARLLAFTQLPVSEIGFRLGYDDPSHFSKRFRAARGCSPRQYRQRFTD